MISIQLPDEQAAALKAKAAAQGLTLEDWLGKLAATEAQASPSRRRKGRYDLAELTAQCDPNAPQPEHSVAITEWLLANDPEALREVVELIRNSIQSLGRGPTTNTGDGPSSVR